MNSKIEKKEYFIFKIKNLKFLRFLVKPFVEINRFFSHKSYLKSKDRTYIQSLHNTKKGRRCFIIGNGPSLTPEDLNRLKDEDTFAFNRIFYIFNKTSWRPTYYMCVDPAVLGLNLNEIQQLQLDNIFLSSIIKRRISNEKIHFIFDKSRFKINRYSFDNPHVSEDVSNYFCYCFTVTYDAIQLAIYMGYDQIYLLGVDHNYSRKVDSNGNIIIDNNVKDYFEGLNKTDITLMNYEATTKAFLSAREYCEKKHIEIKNATRGGQLEVFDRVSFDELINNKK